MAGKRRLTANQKEFQKQVQRIQRAIRRNASQGYHLTQAVDLTRPERVTKKVLANLRNITPKQLRQISVYVDEYGEVIRNAQEEFTQRQVNQRQKRKAKKGIIKQDAFYEMEIQGLIDDLSQAMQSDKQYVVNNFYRTERWIREQVRKYGAAEVAKELERMQQSGRLVNVKYFYSNAETAQWLFDLVDGLGEGGPMTREQIQDMYDDTAWVEDYVSTR